MSDLNPTTFYGFKIKGYDEYQHTKMKSCLTNVRTYRADQDLCTQILNAIKAHKKGGKPLNLLRHKKDLEHLDRHYNLPAALKNGCIDKPPIQNETDFNHALNYLLEIKKENAPYSMEQQLVILKALLEYEAKKISPKEV